MIQRSDRSPLKREIAVDVLKSIGMIGVILHHIHYPDTVGTRFSAEHMIDSIFCCDLFIFLFISGYLTKRYFGFESVITFIAKRTRRLLIPYLWFGLIYLVIFQISSFLNLTVLDGKPGLTFTKALIALLTIDSNNTIGAHLYYLILIYVVSLLFLCFGKIERMRIKEISIITIFFIGLTVMRSLGMINHTGFQPETILPGLFIFLIGYYYSRTQRQKKLWNILIFSMLLVSVCTDLVLKELEMVRVIAPITLFTVLSHMNLNRRSFLFLQKIGMSTPTLFIYHKPIMMRGFAFVFLSLGIPFLISTGFTIVLTFISCMALYRIAVRYHIHELIIYH